MSALSGPERKQAMDAITKVCLKRFFSFPDVNHGPTLKPPPSPQTIDTFLKSQDPKMDEAFYRPDLVLVKGTKDWDLKGVSQAVVVHEDEKERKFTLTGKLVSGGDYGSYTLQGQAFAWK